MTPPTPQQRERARVRTNGADEVFQEVGKGPWRLSRSRFSLVHDTYKWTLRFYDGNPYKTHDHAQIQENAERLCWTLNHITQLEQRNLDLAAALADAYEQGVKDGRG